MKFTIASLKKFLNTTATTEEIIKKLTEIGLEVEEFSNQGEIYATFIIAQIISTCPHPEANKLQICQVNNGKEVLQIVCGAPNARAGIKVVLAPVGALIPSNGLKIKESKIRNIASQGMLCSGSELNLSEESDGIIELSDSYIVGTSFAQSYGLNETLVEISITPNRGDCLGVYGIARDLAAAGMGELNKLEAVEHKGNFVSPINVKISESDSCPKYIGRYFKNIKNSASPLWLQNFLKSIGQKPISALVDITNYFTFTFGRPLHVYDADLIGDIEIRSSLKNEKFIALNDKEYSLIGNELVVDSNNKILAMAGIIGEKHSGVSLDTKNIFLEIGLFDANLVAKSARIHQIDTDAKYRFERKLDANFMNIALDLVTEMLMQICGGEPSHPITIDTLKISPTQIDFSLTEMKKKIGIDYDANKVEFILSALGFNVEKSRDGYSVTVPSWRHDVTTKEDIVEEIARIDGYDKIPSIAFPVSDSNELLLDIKQRNIYRIQRFAASLGLDEVVTWSFMNSKKAALFSDLKEELYLKSPISSELDYMRPSIIANLLDVVVKNQNRSINNLGLFELASVFTGVNIDQQHLSLSGIRSGYNYERNIYKDERMVDCFDSKADILKILAEFGFDSSKLNINSSNIPKYYHPGRSGSISLGKVILGYFGEIHPSVLKSYDIETIVVGFELFLDNIPFPKPKFGRKGVASLSDYQMIERDFSFLVDQNISIDSIIKIISQIDKKLFKNINIFDIYCGKGIEPNKKSIAFSVSLQANDRTLSEIEIEEVSQKIIEAVTKSTNGTLRSA
ncbi:MAG: phenylalanine--tRNA ligase subunit beta [Rickettsiales bacterium]